MERCECCQEEFPRVGVVLRNGVLDGGTEHLCQVCAALIAHEQLERIVTSSLTTPDLPPARLVGRLAA